MKVSLVLLFLEEHRAVLSLGFKHHFQKFLGLYACGILTVGHKLLVSSSKSTIHDTYGIFLEAK